MSEEKDSTANHQYSVPQEGESNWHIPLNENLEKIDTGIEIRDQEKNLDQYLPKLGAKFLATDTGVIYLGDENSWIRIGSITTSENSDFTAVDGIEHSRDYIGPLHQGDYHKPGTDRWGIHFWAESGLTIQSAVLDYNSVDSTDDTVTVELWNAIEDDSDGKSDSMAVESSPVDSVRISTLSDGPQRVDLKFTIPTNGEYFIGVTGDVQLRRIASWDGWDDYSRSDIDLRFGSRFNDPTSSDYSNYYYYIFDIEVGPETTRILSPISHDVDEIYMRPRDPEEEFDNISPRSLWIDTS